MNTPLIDNITHHDTPEGISLSFMPASVVPRILAWFVDFCVRMLLLVVLGLIFSVFGQLGLGLISLLFFLLMWFYAVFFEVFWHGQTIGKRLFRIRVCMDNGMPITWQASMIRNLLLAADFLPMGFFAGIFTMLFHHRSKRLGDIVAGTMVVHITTAAAHFDVIKAPAILPPMSLNLDEQRAILSFVERADGLTEGRVVELVQILAPLTGKDDIEQAGDEIVGYANAIVGTDSSDKNLANGG